MGELPTITLEKIRETAKKQNATLIEYAIVPDEDFKFRGKQRANAGKLLIWVVNPNGKITMRQVDLILKRKTQGTLDFTITIARCLSPSCPTLADGLNLPAIPDSPDPVPDAFFYPGLPELYQTLIQPIADLLPKNPTDRIVIIPQESLFLVPFAALPNSKGTYLIEQHTLAYAPSIQVLGLIQPRPTSTAPNPLIVGNPSPMPENLPQLPASETEAVAIAKLFKTTAITGAAATRANIYPKLERATHIHLATHGLLEYGQIEAIDTPGAIALAPSPGDNGLLTANDVFNLSLNAELVVLSACDTGRGTLTGDGVLGLSRSWLAAGTPSLIVSLWAVNDTSTAELMTAFYHELQTNPDRAVALRSAMLTTLKQYPSPRDWAAFTLMGL
jgi:CHAT domain-containing protein